LSEFILAMVDGNSKFDKHLKNEKIFSLEENMGKEVFLTHCNNCHLIFNRFNTSFDSIPYSNNSSGFGNIGLSFNNEGNGNNGKGFRIPNLRNIEFTAPYMHDGRFNSLREVIEHYNSGVILNPNLSSFLIGADGNPKQMNLSELEKEALEKFLLTLSDDSIILDEKFSNPYIE
jgi:cytochrome c peroxidase